MTTAEESAQAAHTQLNAEHEAVKEAASARIVARWAQVTR